MIQRTLTLRRAIVVVVVFGLLVPALLISGYSWFQRYDEDVKQRTQELLQQNADVLSKAMNDPLWNIDAENGRALVDAMMSHNEDIIKIEVRDASLGVFVQDERPERRSGYTATTEKPVKYRGSNIGSIRIEVGSARLRRLLIDNIEQQSLALLAQIVLSIALILILLERRLVAPLQKLGRGAEDLASRKLDVPFTWSRLDEIGLLSQRLEATRMSLQTLFGELDRKNQALERDIDKRKRIERELHEREARFRALVEQSPIAIIEWDSQYRVLEWNAAAERIFGYTREQAIGQHGSFINPALADHTDGRDARSAVWFDENRTYHIEDNVRADGRTIVCQWS
ncbi:MAG: PAS domain S-box protein, partial [Burkholderiaceae bacterium]|nr:PAS domain S-box protein [Burkholderiaceae bacterium]